MALPASGPLTLAQIQTEFGGTNPIDLSEYYRGGAYVTANNTGVPTSGTISIGNFYGAVKQFAFTISSNLATAQNLRTLALAAGWNAADPVLATIATGVVISPTNTGQAALTISGSFPAGVILVNNGYIVGQGGSGGNGNAFNGFAGGPALSVSTSVSINNTSGVIAGGGGGGGGGAAGGTGGRLGGGGGGGGGQTGLTASAAGPGGPAPWYPGFDGTTGSFSAAGTGGAAGYVPWGGGGGAGGAWGTAGSAGIVGIDASYPTSGAGGAAGNAVTGNSNITWLATGTRYGPIT